MSPKRSILFIFLSLVLAASACGASDFAEVEVANGGSDYAPDDPVSNEPIPVEPDGGIGDGAAPLPGTENPADEGTWHGQEVAATNCPGIEWARVQASEFSFSVPADYVKQDAQPIDSEVGYWNGGDNVEISYDYGWYSGSIAGMPGAENEPIDYSGIAGELTVISDVPQKWVGVLFEEVKEVNGDWDRLGLTVRFTDPNDEIIGRCVVGSIEWG